MKDEQSTTEDVGALDGPNVRSNHLILFKSVIKSP